MHSYFSILSACIAASSDINESIKIIPNDFMRTCCGFNVPSNFQPTWIEVLKITLKRIVLLVSVFVLLDYTVDISMFIPVGKYGQRWTGGL